MKKIVLHIVLGACLLSTGCGGSDQIGSVVTAFQTPPQTQTETETETQPESPSPIATDDFYTVTANQTRVVDAASGLFQNDTLNGATLNQVNSATTAGGTVLAQSDGSFTYTPSTGFVGDDSFQYTLRNNVQSVSATVSLRVEFNLAGFQAASITSTGTAGNGESSDGAVDGTGQIVVFESSASDLVVGDTNGSRDIFLFDRVLGLLERVSLGVGGVEADGSSTSPEISSDGRFVVFESEAENLVADDTNSHQDIFLLDRTLDTIERVSVDSSGGDANSSSSDPKVSDDGRFVVFTSTASDLTATGSGEQIYLRNLQLDTTLLVSATSAGQPGNGDSSQPEISRDGNFIVFRSLATDLVTPDSNGTRDVFLYDRVNSTLEIVSRNASGEQSDESVFDPIVSGDGRFVAFNSRADNLVPNDTGGFDDIFLVDTLLDTIERISVSSDGTQANDDSIDAQFDGSGRFIVFASDATNLVDNDTNNAEDSFVRDTQTDTTAIISLSATGIQGNGDSNDPFISTDGKVVFFQSEATNFIATDTNGEKDAFVVGNPLSP